MMTLETTAEKKQKIEREDLNFVTRPSTSLLCPICKEVCQDPVITHRCHHSYCLSCIYQSIEVEPFCPLCRCRLRNEDLHPNLALASLIGELKVLCPNQQYGCNLSINLEAIDYHFKNCEFAPSCCPHKDFGCSFSGTVLQVKEHLEICNYEAIKPFIESTQNKINFLKLQLEEQARQMEELKLLFANKPPLVVEVPLEVNPEMQVPEASASEIITEKFPNGNITCTLTLKDHKSGVTSLAYSNGLLFSGAHDGSTKIYEINGSNVAKVWDHSTHQTSVWSLAVFQDEKRFFTASSDHLVKAWDWTQPLAPAQDSDQVLDDHSGKVYALLCRYGKLFSGSSDRTIKVWDPRSLELSSTLLGHQDNVNTLSAIRNNRIASGSSDRTIKIWDIATSQCISTIDTQGSEVLDITVSDDHQLLFASTYDAAIHVYSLNDHSLVSTLSGHNWEVWQVAYANNQLFSASFDHTIKRWDPRMFNCNSTLLGHKGFVHALALSSDSLFSGCADRTIKVWK